MLAYSRYLRVAVNFQAFMKDRQGDLCMHRTADGIQYRALS
jgi:hypothetical protein